MKLEKQGDLLISCLLKASNSVRKALNRVGGVTESVRLRSWRCGQEESPVLEDDPVWKVFRDWIKVRGPVD